LESEEKYEEMELIWEEQNEMMLIHSVEMDDPVTARLKLDSNVKEQTVMK